MNLNGNAGKFCQIWLLDALGVPDMLEDYLCSHQAELRVLAQKKLPVLQNDHRYT